MTEIESEVAVKMVKTLQVANYLSLKATTSKNRESLKFMILNDTVNMIKYDRALLWDLNEKKPKLLGISGESKVSRNAPLVQKWIESVQSIKEPSRAQIMTFAPQTENENIENNVKVTMLWLPIFIHGKPSLGLWLELWGHNEEQTPPQEMINLLMNFLMPSYGAAWEKFSKKFSLDQLGYRKPLFYGAVFAIFLLGGFVKVPMRIVAPCEVVSKNPVLVTAPLEGIVNDILVTPGEKVDVGDVLFEYDKRVPLQELEVARKQVEILQSEIKRAAILGLEDPHARTDLAILKLKLEKQRIELELAEYYASQLSVKAPEAGVIMLDTPDEWRGKPVLIGEKILAITNPENSKIRIWIPEKDNVALDSDTPLIVFLNINPEKSRKASLVYISKESTISEKQIPSFIAEADWIAASPDVRLGLKGTAVLYGEKVSVFYYIFRKPWAFFRNFLGV